MNSFINNLVSRHVDTGNHIKPRLRGRFEPPAITENTLPTDSNNDHSFNDTTEPQTIKQVSNPPFLTKEQDNDNRDKLNIGHPLYRQEQRPSDQFSAERKDMDAGNEKPIQPSVNLPGQANTRFRTENATDTKPNDTVFTTEINRVLTNPKTGEVISGDNRNSTIANGLKNEASSYQNTNSNVSSGNPDTQTIRSSTDNHLLQSKLTGEGLPADLKWLKTIKQDLNTRNGIQNSQSSTPPVIKVTIGKIEVRAVNQSAPVQTRETPKPRMTLDDFLKQRNGGKS